MSPSTPPPSTPRPSPPPPSTPPPSTPRPSTPRPSTPPPSTRPVRLTGATLPILVLDFDGTVCLGDGPVWAYADGVLPHLDSDTARGITDTLAAFLAGEPATDRYADGYMAVAQLAGPHVHAGVLRDAYVDSRQALAEGGLDIHPPDGLADLLAGLGGITRRVVVTNSPDTGLDVALSRLGLAEEIDEVIASAAKPAGLPRILTGLLSGASPANLISVGDVWVNDIAPALEIGCVTAFIDRSRRDGRPAHIRGQRIQDLYPALRRWATEPEGFAQAHVPQQIPDLASPSSNARAVPHS